MRLIVGLSVLVVAAAAACSVPASDARVGVEAPRLDSFPPVADVMTLRCGSLDCHGNRQRNFVVWGCEGLRYDPTMSPSCARGSGTTAVEYAATYDSLVGLEPSVMTTVVRAHGENPELLTFVRKARGDEAHKGGAPVTAGDASDRCIAQWLAGAAPDDATYQTTCTAALRTQ